MLKIKFPVSGRVKLKLSRLYTVTVLTDISLRFDAFAALKILMGLTCHVVLWVFIDISEKCFTSLQMDLIHWASPTRLLSELLRPIPAQNQKCSSDEGDSKCVQNFGGNPSDCSLLEGRGRWDDVNNKMYLKSFEL
jgi:hypothetical protein